MNIPELKSIMLDELIDIQSNEDQLDYDVINCVLHSFKNILSKLEKKEAQTITNTEQTTANKEFNYTLPPIG